MSNEYSNNKGMQEALQEISEKEKKSRNRNICIAFVMGVAALGMVFGTSVLNNITKPQPNNNSQPKLENIAKQSTSTQNSSLDNQQKSENTSVVSSSTESSKEKVPSAEEVDAAKNIFVNDLLKESGYYMGTVSVSDLDQRGKVPYNLDLYKDSIMEISKKNPLEKWNYKPIDDILGVPANPDKKNSIEIKTDEVDISAPINIASFSDYFGFDKDDNVNLGTKPNYQKEGTNKDGDPCYLVDVCSPEQQLLKKGVVLDPASPRPGEIGNSYITGHSSNYDAVKSNYNEVFKNLPKLRVNDKYTVYTNAGNKLEYTITGTKIIEDGDTASAYTLPKDKNGKEDPNARKITLQGSILTDGNLNITAKAPDGHYYVVPGITPQTYKPGDMEKILTSKTLAASNIQPTHRMLVRAKFTPSQDQQNKIAGHEKKQELTNNLKQLKNPEYKVNTINP